LNGAARIRLQLKIQNLKFKIMLSVNLRHLENRNLELRGELPLAELDLDLRDEMIRATQPLHYDLEVEMLDDALLVQGLLRLKLECQCVRCLKDFEYELEIDPWTLHLTPRVREDILLGFPQHPVCKPDCGGLKKASVGKARKTAGKEESKSSAWAELNKLKL
jgi:uncharacterized metal-binding protein YceD (DUF177 family)